jgi:hypothetical protein
LGSLKIGDKVIVTSFKYEGKIGIIIKVDFIDCGGVLPYLVSLEDKYITWCDAVPFSSLMAELV